MIIGFACAVWLGKIRSSLSPFVPLRFMYDAWDEQAEASTGSERLPFSQTRQDLRPDRKLRYLPLVTCDDDRTEQTYS